MLHSLVRTSNLSNITSYNLIKISKIIIILSTNHYDSLKKYKKELKDENIVCKSMIHKRNKQTKKSSLLKRKLTS